MKHLLILLLMIFTFSCSKEAKKANFQVNFSQLALTGTKPVVHLVGRNQADNKMISRILKGGDLAFSEFLDDGVWDFTVYIYNHDVTDMPFEYDPSAVTSCGFFFGYDTSSEADIVMDADFSNCAAIGVNWVGLDDSNVVGDISANLIFNFNIKQCRTMSVSNW